MGTDSSSMLQPRWPWKIKPRPGKSSAGPWKNTKGHKEILANRKTPQDGEAVPHQHCLQQKCGPLISTEDVVSWWMEDFKDLLNPTDTPFFEEAEMGVKDGLTHLPN